MMLQATNKTHVKHVSSTQSPRRTLDGIELQLMRAPYGE